MRNATTLAIKLRSGDFALTCPDAERELASILRVLANQIIEHGALRECEEFMYDHNGNKVGLAIWYVARAREDDA